VFRYSLPIVSLLVFAYWTPSVARAQNSAQIIIRQPWARATPPGTTVGAAYLDVTNTGAADTIVAVESPVAAEVEVHVDYMEGGLMRMRPVPRVPVPAHGHVHLGSGGLYVMLVNLKQPLQEGDHFPLTLVFQNAGRIKVDVPVRGIGAMGPMN
jgi:copper(I)-binding protein